MSAGIGGVDKRPISLSALATCITLEALQSFMTDSMLQPDVIRLPRQTPGRIHDRLELLRCDSQRP